MEAKPVTYDLFVGTFCVGRIRHEGPDPNCWRLTLAGPGYDFHFPTYEDALAGARDAQPLLTGLEDLMDQMSEAKKNLEQWRPPGWVAP